MASTKQYYLYTDGGARGNPGPAAAAYVLLDEQKKLVHSAGIYIGEATNNTAEYLGIQKGLEACVKLQLNNAYIICNLDSELVIYQLKGVYKIKQRHLQELARSIVLIIKQLNDLGVNISFQHIPRAHNKQADQLVNQVLDEQKSLSR